MKSLNTLLKTLSFLTILVCSNWAIAQSEYSFSRFPTHDKDLTTDLQLTENQVNEIQTLQENYWENSRNLSSKLLFPDDKTKELTKLTEKGNKTFETILSAEQLEKYLAYNKQQKAIQLESQRESYIKTVLQIYKFIDLTPEQAELLAENKFENGKKGYSFHMGKAHLEEMKEILTENQLQKFEDFGKEKVESAMSELNFSKEMILHLMEQFSLIIENYYLPERATVRAKIESKLTDSERETLRIIRDAYLNYVPELMDEMLSQIEPFTDGYEDLFEAGKPIMKMMIAHNIQPQTLKDFLHTDRDLFYKSVDLAKKYDRIIDGLQPEVKGLEKGMLTKILPFLPKEIQNEASNDIKSEWRNEKDFQTERVEWKRNIAFLLIESANLEGITTDRSAHNLNVFPIPAKDWQTLEFEVKTTGKTIIEIINADGKVLQKVFNGRLDKGNHSQKVQLADVADQIFFYRIKNKQGTSIMRSIKVN